MRNWITAALACTTFAVAWAAPSVAAADDCTCGVFDPSSVTWVDASAFVTRPDAVSEPSVGDEAVSRPVDEIASLPLDLAPAPNFVAGVPGDLAHHAPPTRPERILWCDGSDDPRCEQGTAPPNGESGAPVSTLLGWTAVGVPHVSTIALTAYAAGPSDGVRDGVERPPQA